MHPAFSVIFLTTLIGVGQGLFLALFMGQFYSAAQFLPSEVSNDFYSMGSLIALLFLIAGLISSFFHLGHPERAWRSAARWRTSWLSREVIALPLTMGIIFVYGVMQYMGWDHVIFTSSTGAELTLSLVVAAIGAVSVFSLFICTAMIYACIKFLQEWASPLTVINYFLLGSASGFTLATAFSSITEPAFLNFYGGFAIALTILAMLSRGASLYRNAHIKYKSTIQSAIGVRHNTIVQIAQGAMGGSFNTREYFHGKSAFFLKSIKYIFVILVFFVPLALLTVGISSGNSSVLILAFLVQYVGLVAERWFFFAQANHPQNIYYQTV